MPDAIPDAVVSLVCEHVRSIAQLELLLTLHSQPENSWNVEEAAKQLYTAVSMTAPLLESLRGMGLVVRSDDSSPRYRYSPKSQEVAATVDELAQLYQSRRVSIINLIYAGPVKKLQNFADAFRIRQKDEGD